MLLGLFGGGGIQAANVAQQVFACIFSEEHRDISTVAGKGEAGVRVGVENSAVDVDIAAVASQVVGQAVDVCAYLLGGVLEGRIVFTAPAADLMLHPVFAFKIAGNVAVAVFYLYDHKPGRTDDHQIHFAGFAPVADGGILQAEVSIRQVLQKSRAVQFSLNTGFQAIQPPDGDKGNEHTNKKPSKTNDDQRRLQGSNTGNEQDNTQKAQQKPPQGVVLLALVLPLQMGRFFDYFRHKITPEIRFFLYYTISFFCCLLDIFTPKE